MVRIVFSDPRPGEEVIPLAVACGISRDDRPMFDRLRREGPALWRAADWSQADLAVYANRYDDLPAAHDFAGRAAAAGLPCLFFDTSDCHDIYRPPHGVVYRSAVYADRLTPSDRAMPAPCDDMLADAGGRLALREKSDRPSVGFCGYVSPWYRQLLRAVRGEAEKIRGHRVRRSAIAALRHSRRVETCFDVRPDFWGGALAANWDPVTLRRARSRFAANVLGSDYTLCARGAGNFSTRFYEALSAGRIPLLIDTRCVLPFADRIDWRRHCLIVAEGDIARAGDLLAQFHAGLTPEQFRELQTDNRRLWEEWLEPLSAHRRVVADALTGAAQSAV